MKPENVYLAAIGSWLPPAFPAEAAVAAGLYSPEEYAESGLRSVLVAGTESPPDMAVHAARTALSRSSSSADSVGMLFHSAVFYQGPEMWSVPGYILRELGIEGASATEIRNGCNGMFTAIELAAALLPRLPDDRPSILLTTADNFNSPLVNRWESGPMGVIGADGGSAVVLSRSGGFARLESIVSRIYPELEGLSRGDDPLFPPTGSSGARIDVAARARQFTGNQATSAVGRAVGQKIGTAYAKMAHAALADADLEISDVRWVVCGNGDRVMTQRCIIEPLGIDISKSLWDFGCDVGHVAASDHIISLDHLIREGRITAGDHILLLGGGPGWSAAAAVLTITAIPDWI